LSLTSRQRYKASTKQVQREKYSIVLPVDVNYYDNYKQFSLTANWTGNGNNRHLWKQYYHTFQLW